MTIQEQADRHMPTEVGMPPTRISERGYSGLLWVREGIQTVKTPEGAHFERPVQLIERTPESRAKYRASLAPKERALLDDFERIQNDAKP